MSLTSVFVLFAAVEWMVHKLSWQVLVRSKPEVADGREPRWRPSFLIGRLHSCIRTKLWRTLSQQNESLNTKMLYWTWSKIKFYRLCYFYFITLCRKYLQCEATVHISLLLYYDGQNFVSWIDQAQFDKNKFTDDYLFRNFHHVIYMYFENQK